MRFLETLALFAFVSIVVTATADEGDALAQDLSELRRQMGSPHQADSDEFQQAVREVAKRNRAGDTRPDENWATPHWGTPPRGFRAGIPHRPHEAPSPWPNARRSPYRPQPTPTPASRLRETAFQLDRLAHELEMAELYEGADTLRFAAGKLRKSARRAVLSRQDVPGQDGPAIASPSPAGKSLPK